MGYDLDSAPGAALVFQAPAQERAFAASVAQVSGERLGVFEGLVAPTSPYVCFKVLEFC
jgi:hypothetical protein